MPSLAECITFYSMFSFSCSEQPCSASTSYTPLVSILLNSHAVEQDHMFMKDACQLSLTTICLVYPVLNSNTVPVPPTTYTHLVSILLGSHAVEQDHIFMKDACFSWMYHFLLYALFILFWTALQCQYDLHSSCIYFPWKSYSRARSCSHERCRCLHHFLLYA